MDQGLRTTDAVDGSAASVALWSAIILGSLTAGAVLFATGSLWLDRGDAVVGAFALTGAALVLLASGLILGSPWLVGAVLPARWLGARPERWTWREAFALVQASERRHAGRVVDLLQRLEDVGPPTGGQDVADRLRIEDHLRAVDGPMRRRMLLVQASVGLAALALPVGMLVAVFTDAVDSIGPWYGPLVAAVFAGALMLGSMAAMRMWCVWYIQNVAPFHRILAKD